MKAELLDVFGTDDTVVDCARVSFSKHHSNYTEEQNAKLIEYLAKHKHWAPLAHPKAQFRIDAPIFVARQWEKHRIGAVRGYDIYDHSEESRRYVDDSPTFWAPGAWRSRPDGSIKQGSGVLLPGEVSSRVDDMYRNALDVAAVVYEQMLGLGVAPEMARAVLPQSTYTSWIETGSLYYWANLCRLRTDSHAQQEIQQLAWQVADQMVDKFPVSWVALMRYGK
jgi:thymidylate synthase (FAD)